MKNRGDFLPAGLQAENNLENDVARRPLVLWGAVRHPPLLRCLVTKHRLQLRTAQARLGGRTFSAYWRAACRGGGGSVRTTALFGSVPAGRERGPPHGGPPGHP
jgi:hypothetical protein